MLTGRILCLFLPRLPVAVARKARPDLAALPLIVYQGIGARSVVLTACERAEAAGVASGMLLARAQSLCPLAMALPADASAYAQVQAELLTLLQWHSPFVNSGNMGGLAYLACHRVDNETQLAQSLLMAMEKLGYAARVGIAGSKFAAEMTARYGSSRVNICRSGGDAAALAKLPLSVLPEAEQPWREMKRRLRQLGFQTLGELAQLGQTALQAQFGMAGKAAWRLASGQTEPFSPLPLPREHSVSKRPESPIQDWPPLEMVLISAAGELAALLRERGLICPFLCLSWQGELAEHKSSTAVKINLPLEKALFIAAKRALPAELPEPIKQFTLTAAATMPEPGNQASLFSAGREQELRLAQVGEELRLRLGRETLLRPRPLRPSSLEERCYAFLPL